MTPISKVQGASFFAVIMLPFNLRQKAFSAFISPSRHQLCTQPHYFFDPDCVITSLPLAEDTFIQIFEVALPILQGASMLLAPVQHIGMHIGRAPCCCKTNSRPLKSRKRASFLHLVLTQGGNVKGPSVANVTAGRRAYIISLSVFWLIHVTSTPWSVKRCWAIRGGVGTS